jgi:amino acid transporter
VDSGPSLDQLHRNHYSQELDRSLHPFRAVIMGVASCGPIGSVFTYVPILLLICGTFSFWALVLAAGLCICQGLAYAEVGSAYPIAGGEYSMVGMVLGRLMGLITFALMSAMYLFVPAAAALAGGIYLGVIWGWAGTHTHAIAVAIIVWAAVVSFLRVKLGTWVAGFFVAVQIIALCVVTILGLVHWHSPSERLFTVTPALTWQSALLGLTIAFFIYQGFGNVIIFSEETKKAKSLIGRAAMSATVMAILVIFIPSVALMIGAPSLKVLLTSATPLSDTVSAWGGAFFGKAISLIIFFAILDLATASMMAFARVYWAGGRDNVWPGPISKAMAYVNPRFKTPWVAVIVFAVACGVIAGVSNIAAAVTFTGVITLAYAGLMALSAIVIRLKKDPPDRYKMPLWPFPPVVLAGVCIVLGTQQKLSDLYVVLAIAGAFLLYYLIFLRSRPGHWQMLEPIDELSEYAAEGGTT